MEQAVSALKAAEDKKNGFNQKLRAMQEEINFSATLSEANKENIQGLSEKVQELKQDLKSRSA